MLYPHPIKIERTVTEEEVQDTIAKTSPLKAPGPDQIPNKILKELYSIISPTLANIFTACLEAEHHPGQFKLSITAILKKPQKPDYSIPGAYRPIALLSTVGKLLEHIVAERLANTAETHHLLPETQMGARQKRSTLTALNLLTEQIHTVWAMDPKAIVTMLSLNITGAYNQVSHKRLLHNLQTKRIPKWAINYIASFLAGRTTQLSFASYMSEPITVQTGIPQGSALSPIIFLYYVYELLDTLQGQNSSSFGFVDNHNLLTWSQTTAANCKRLEQMHDNCISWAKRHSMTWNPDKYSVIHFTRQHQVEGLCLSRKPNIGMKDNPVQSLKVLGVWIDSKLSWKPHIKNTVSKATGYVTTMGRLLSSTWGTTLQRSRQIYTAVIHPTLTHGCNIWYTPHTPSCTQPRDSIIQPLMTAQNKALHKITGAYKATPILVLEKEAGIEPLQVYIQGQAIKHTLKQKDSDRQKAIKNAITKIERAHQRQRG